MKPLLIVKAGATYPEMATRFGDFDDWIKCYLDLSGSAVQTVSPYAGEVLPDAAAYGGVLITGSHAMVTDRHAWSERTSHWIRGVVEAGIPLLGICYGHQLLAHAMGGRVGDNPNGKEIGTVTLTLNDDGIRDLLFAQTPRRFAAQACHTQSVLTLPHGATLLASSISDPHHAFAIGKRAWGVQFHPEFNQGILRLYIDRFLEEPAAKGQDGSTLRAGIQETPHSGALLRRFQSLCNRS